MLPDTTRASARDGVARCRHVSHCHRRQYSCQLRECARRCVDDMMTYDDYAALLRVADERVAIDVDYGLPRLNDVAYGAGTRHSPALCLSARSALLRSVYAMIDIDCQRLMARARQRDARARRFAPDAEISEMSRATMPRMPPILLRCRHPLRHFLTARHHVVCHQQATAAEHQEPRRGRENSERAAW